MSILDFWSYRISGGLRTIVRSLTASRAFLFIHLGQMDNPTQIGLNRLLPRLFGLVEFQFFCDGVDINSKCSPNTENVVITDLPNSLM